MRFLLFFTAVFVFFAVATKTLAQDPVPASHPAAASAGKAGEVLQQSTEKVKSWTESIPTEVAAWILAAIAVFSELLVRFIPTAKPRSWLLVVAYLLELSSSFFSALASASGKLSKFLDQFIQSVAPKSKK